jgi:hypothetical protein
VNGYSDDIINIIGMGKIYLFMELEVNVPSETLRSVASYAIILIYPRRTGMGTRKDLAETGLS